MNEQLSTKAQWLRLLLLRALFVLGCVAGVTAMHWLLTSAPANASTPVVSSVSNLAGQELLGSTPQIVRDATEHAADAADHLVEHVSTVDKRIQPIIPVHIVRQVDNYLARLVTGNNRSDYLAAELAVSIKPQLSKVAVSKKAHAVSRDGLLDNALRGQVKNSSLLTGADQHLFGPQSIILPSNPLTNSSSSNAGTGAPTFAYLGQGTGVFPSNSLVGVVADTLTRAPIAPKEKSEHTPD